jgi:hypothetical protein
VSAAVPDAVTEPVVEPAREPVVAQVREPVTERVVEPVRERVPEPGAPAVTWDRPVVRRRKVVAGVVGVLTATVAAVALAVLNDGDDPADRARTPVVRQDGGLAAGEQAGAGDSSVAVPVGPVEPLAPDAPSDGLALGSAGRAGLRRVDPAATGPAGQFLPRFFRAAANGTGGYAVGVPQQFGVVTLGPVTFVEWDDDTMFRADFEVRSYRPVDPWTRLVQDEQQFAREHKGDGYRREQLTRRSTYRGRDAALWEFTWRLNGEVMHARQVAFRDGPRTYTVLYRSTDLWWLGGGTSAYPEGFERAFHPLP